MRILFIGHTRRGDAVLSSGLLGHLIQAQARVTVLCGPLPAHLYAPAPGVEHMAAAAGVATVGLFGPSRPEHYTPWGPAADFVRTAKSYDELVGPPGYDHRTTDSLMGSLEFEAAAAGVAPWRRARGEAA